MTDPVELVVDDLVEGPTTVVRRPTTGSRPQGLRGCPNSVGTEGNTDGPTGPPVGGRDDSSKGMSVSPTSRYDERLDLILIDTQSITFYKVDIDDTIQGN